MANQSCRLDVVQLICCTHGEIGVEIKTTVFEKVFLETVNSVEIHHGRCRLDDYNSFVVHKEKSVNSFVTGSIFMGF